VRPSYSSGKLYPQLTEKLHHTSVSANVTKRQKQRAEADNYYFGRSFQKLQIISLLTAAHCQGKFGWRNGYKVMHGNKGLQKRGDSFQKI
jgi:hypothetical protein